MTGRVVTLLIAAIVAVAGVSPADATIVFNPANGHWYATNLDVDLSANTFPGAKTAAEGAVLAQCPGCTSHLATLTSLAENQFIGTSYAAEDFGFFGLYQPGIFDAVNGAGGETEPGKPAQGAAGQWTWVTSEPFYSGDTVIFHNWRVATDEPNDGGDNSAAAPHEDAAEHAGTDTNGLLWNDVFNDTSQGFLIEFEPAVNGGAVPEPGSLLLIGTGLAALLVRRKRN